MTETIHFNEIIKNLELIYYNNLLKASEKSTVNKKMIEMRINELKSVSVKPEIIKSDNTTVDNDTKTISDSSIQKYNDDYLYKKQWNKLTAIHKKIKVKEFVNMLLIDLENEKDELKNKLSMLIDNKELTKKDAIIYDSSKGKIVSIPLLKFTNGKYIV